MPTCGSCRFFDARDQACRRNPPEQIVQNEEGQLGVALPPTTADTMACGEWRGNPNEIRCAECAWWNIRGKEQNICFLSDAVNRVTAANDRCDAFYPREESGE